MTPDLRDKVARWMIIATIFVAVVIMQGIEPRQANLVVMMLASIVVMSLFLSNLWATLFVTWTVFLYVFFKFDCGEVYLTNIVFGSMLYLFTKTSFKKKHVDLYITAFLWFVFVNLAYSIVQVFGFDFIYTHTAWDGFIFQPAESNRIAGFMGHESMIGTLLAFAIPILASRGSKTAWLGAILLFIPLYLCKTALCLVAGVIGLLYVMFFKVKRQIWIGCIVIMMLFSVFYVSKVDPFGTERFVHWHTVMKDAMKHPITGWGLDSFGNITKSKDFLYPQNKYSRPEYVYRGKKYNNITAIMWWDNPHNLLISLFYEFGILGVFFVFMYFRKLALKFKSAIKSPNAIGLSGLALLFALISMGHFPMFLARLAPIIICSFALFEVEIA